MEQQTDASAILKKEAVGYLKSSFNLQQGTLLMTDQFIRLEAHKAGVGGLGLLGFLLKSKVEKVNTIFHLHFDAVQSVEQGKHGAQKNILEITDNENIKHRIIVKNYSEWADAIGEYKK
jgi:hypothetical protein